MPVRFVASLLALTLWVGASMPCATPAAPSPVRGVLADAPDENPANHDHGTLAVAETAEMPCHDEPAPRALPPSPLDWDGPCLCGCDPLRGTSGPAWSRLPVAVFTPDLEALEASRAVEGHVPLPALEDAFVRTFDHVPLA